jgi:D-alanyl-D-alanine carboxypeptidase
MLRRRIVRLVCLGLGVCTALLVAAPANAAFTPKLKRELALAVKNNMTDLRLPGVSVGVWQPGRGRWVRAFGIANRRTGRPARIKDHVRIASNTKTFTATAILQLVDKGRLSLEDNLSKFFPEIDNADQITIRQMLNMTSGIYDYSDDPSLGDPFYAKPTLPFSPAQFFAILARNEPSFPPGTAAEYSDSNYYLLGLILQRVTGRPAGEVITDQIIRRLRLTQTSYPTGPPLPKPFARGYFGGVDLTDPLIDKTLMNPAVSAGAGAMQSTLADLRKWVRVLATGTLLSPGLQAQRLQTLPFPNPGPVDISYGLGIFKLDNLLGHNGAIVGYSTAMFYLPSKRATIVIWGNNSTNATTPTTTIAFDLAEILFPKAVDQGVIQGTTPGSP